MPKRLYNAWYNMKNRCTNTSLPKFHLYGGRGIRVCRRWMLFSNFVKDMGPHPGKGFTLDRYPDKNGNYSPANCRWATYAEQAHNMRSTKLDFVKAAAIRASTASIHSLARQYGVARRTIYQCLRYETWV